MSENFNALTPEQTEVLAILSEECAEVIQAVGKVLRHGLECSHPSMGNWSNRSQLKKEMADAFTSIIVSAQILQFSDREMSDLVDSKLEELKKWTHHIDWSKLDL